MTASVRTSFVIALTLGAVLLNGAGAAEPDQLDPHLEPLRPFLGKTWKGVFKDSTPERPIADIANWERALNGKAVRILHSVNDGIYGGETLITWDESKQQVVSHYFTTADFRTVGEIKLEDGKLITHEKVTGGARGITEVKAVTEFKDGKFTVKAEYLKDGQWSPGREATYEEAPDAKVIFK